MFGMHLYEIVTVFLFTILERGCEGGKHLSIILRNFAPMFVDTFIEYGGLNQVIFLDLHLFELLLGGGTYFSLYVWPLFSSDAL
jgi:hypothetical protein